MALPFHPRRPAKRARGFTLVELAMVLVIVTLLLTGGIMTITAQNQSSQQREAERQIQEIQEALLGFAIANRRLPRPAVSATNGAERGACGNDAECSGFLPWQTLGLGMSDPYGKRYRYSVTPAYAGGPGGTDPISVNQAANRTVQTRDGSGTLVYLVGRGVCAAPASQCAPAVILSHGARYHGASGLDGTAIADGSGTNTDEDNNAVNSINYIQRPSTDNPAAAGGEFDDIVLWLPLHILINRLVQAERL